MAKIFISYSRKDIEFAKKLAGELQKNDLDFWVDWEGIPPTVDWWKEIEKGIEEADVFLFLISPDSSSSKICGQEIDYAVKNGKRVVPLVVREVKGSDAPPQLSHLNWIFFREQDDFNAAFQKLLTAINTDYEWVQNHRRLQIKALEWEKNHKDRSFLLRGKDLHDAEYLLAANSSKEPRPTDLQREFVFKSDQAAERQQRIVTGIAIVGFIILAALAAFGFYQANQAGIERDKAQVNEQKAKDSALAAEKSAEEAKIAQAKAEEQTKKALAGSLAAQADSLKSTDHPLGLLLGMEAYKSEDNLLTRTTLFQMLQFSPHTILFGYNGPVSSLAVSPDGKILASASCREYDNNQCKYGEIVLTDEQTNQPLKRLAGEYGIVNSMAFHKYADRVLLAAAGCVPVDRLHKGCLSNKGQITLWDVTDPNAPTQLANMTDGHKGLVQTIAINHEGNLLASGSFDTRIILWNISRPASPFMASVPLQKHTSFVNGLTFSPDDRILVSGGDDSQIILWDVSKPSTSKQLGDAILTHTAAVNRVVFSPNGTQLASASNDGLVLLWSWNAVRRRLEHPRKLQGHDGYVTALAFSTAEKILASVGFDSKVILWNTDTGEQIGLPLVAHTKAINDVAFGAEDSHDELFTGGNDRTVIHWDLFSRATSSKPIKTPTLPNELGRAAASGSIQASVINEQQIELSGRTEALTGHTGAINTLNFGRLIGGRIFLVSASDDQTVIIWDVSNPANASVFLKLENFNNPVSAAYFNGRKLITVEKDGRSIQWDVLPNEWLPLACSAAHRNLASIEWERFLPGKQYQKTCQAYQ